MESARGNDVGRLVLRLAVGGLMLFHGAHKLLHGIGGIEHAVVAHGLPRVVAYGVLIGEVVAPLLVLAGFATRPAAAVIAVNMVVAIALAHAASIASLDPHTGGLAVELPVLYLLGAVAIAALGAGRIAVSRGRGRWD